MKVGQFNNNQEQQALWTKLQIGDETAFMQLYQRNVSVVYQYAKSIAADEGLIDAAIQQLFADLWNSRINLPVPASVTFYFYSAVKSRLENSRLLKKPTLKEQSV